MKPLYRILFRFLLICLLIPNADAQQTTISDSAKELVEGNNQFALEMYGSLAETQDGNVFISPWSISTAFGMAWAGARTETADQMADVLHFSSDQMTTHSAFDELFGSLNAIQEEGYLVMNTANAMWPAVGFPVRTDYADLLEAYYHAYAESLDYLNKTEESRLRINDWVSENTMNRIPELLIKGTLSGNVALVLTNAVYFKGTWQTLFDPEETVDDVFISSDGTETDVKMMQLREDLPIFVNDDLILVTLPYHGEQMEAVLISPKDGDLPGLETDLSAERLNNWLDSRVERETIVRLPRFSLRYKTDLVENLKLMGMQLPFSSAADFSGMFAAGGIAISKVIHETFLQVKEEGTEAAGATAIIIERTSVDPTPVFSGNRPFLFLIRDTVTGSLLFMGRIEKPAPLEEETTTVDPETVKACFGQEATLEDGWWTNTSIGRFRSDKWPWLEHESMGWLYVDVDTADPETGYWLYDFNLGWLYAFPALPSFYWDSEQDWLYYLEGSTDPRWFFRFSDVTWIEG